MNRAFAVLALLVLAGASFGYERVVVCEEAYQET